MAHRMEMRREWLDDFLRENYLKAFDIDLSRLFYQRSGYLVSKRMIQRRRLELRLLRPWDNVLKLKAEARGRG